MNVEVFPKKIRVLLFSSQQSAHVYLTDAQLNEYSSMENKTSHTGSIDAISVVVYKYSHQS